MTNNAEQEKPTQREGKSSEPLATPELENEKLKLEVRLLERQLSTKGMALEWFKSGTVLVALIGVAVTLWVGFGQVKQAEQNRISERLDKALTRLASEKPNERMTGVSSLRLFLGERDSSLKAQALSFLVDAASVEADPLVQSAILDVFGNLKGSGVSQADLDALLKIVLERSRSLAGSIRGQSSQRITKDKWLRLAGIARLNLNPDQIPDEIPKTLIAKLSQDEYLTLLESERGQFERLEPKLETPLKGVSQLITTLLKLGAKANDFSLIFCQGCDFSAARDLSGAKFDKANLERANFSRVNLKNASFRDANLSDTVFFAADLSNANLRDNTLEVDWGEITYGLPMFECANLKGADLSGTPLLVYEQVYWPDNQNQKVIAPRMLSTEIDKTTKLDYFTIVAVTRVSDAYLMKHAKDARFSHFLGKDAENSIFLYAYFPCTYRRLKANYAHDEAALSSTTCIQLSQVGGDHNKIEFLRPELRETLSGFLDQPMLNEIALLSAINGELGPPSKKQPWKAVSEYACKDIDPPKPYKLRIQRVHNR